MQLYYAALLPIPKDPDGFILSPHSKKEHEIVVEIVERLADGTESHTYIRKTIASIVVLSTEDAPAAPEDCWRRHVQIMEGSGEIIMSGKKETFTQGDSFLIPPWTSYEINSAGTFKIIIGILPASVRCSQDSGPADVSAF